MHLYKQIQLKYDSNLLSTGWNAIIDYVCDFGLLIFVCHVVNLYRVSFIYHSIMCLKYFVVLFHSGIFYRHFLAMSSGYTITEELSETIH